MINLVGIKVKYHGPTNTLGTRIGLTLVQTFSTTKKITIVWDYSTNSNDGLVGQATAFLKSKGINVFAKVMDDMLLINYDQIEKVLEVFKC